MTDVIFALFYLVWYSIGINSKNNQRIYGKKH
jgi:hypothetical protein